MAVVVRATLNIYIWGNASNWTDSTRYMHIPRFVASRPIICYNTIYLARETTNAFISMAAIAFLPPFASVSSATCRTTPSASASSSPLAASSRKVVRRSFVRLLALAATANIAARAGEEWKDDELCSECLGRGDLACVFCEGSGEFAMGDELVNYSLECPNCMGIGTVKCSACIGLGLAKTNGILRDGARDGRLRMRRDGNYEVLQCDAFPSCSMYGRGRVPKVAREFKSTLPDG